MSPDSTRGWDSRIRPWVGHPAAEAPAHSVCYQMLPPNGSLAALAFRYRMRQQAQRDQPIEGRPLVSRVLVGNASLLTPEVAIALCRTGLPSLAGERPGQVTAGAELPSVSADDLASLVADAAPGLDDEAAWTDGLSQVIAVALADPGAPLAVAVADDRIRGDADEIGPLLWGLCRVIRPLLGTVRRGWSFSTYQPPLDPADLAAAPDIVFREAGAERALSDAPRREAEVLVGAPGASPGLSEHGELAGTSQAWLADWLVAEYRAADGQAITRLVAECGVEQPLQARLAAIYDILHARWVGKPVEPARLAFCPAPDPAAEPAPELAAPGTEAAAEPGGPDGAAGHPGAGPGPGLDQPPGELTDGEPGRRPPEQASEVAAGTEAAAGPARPGGEAGADGRPPAGPGPESFTGEPPKYQQTDCRYVNDERADGRSVGVEQAGGRSVGVGRVGRGSAGVEQAGSGSVDDGSAGVEGAGSWPAGVERAGGGQPDDEFPRSARPAWVLAEAGALGPLPRQGTPPPLPPRPQGSFQREWEQRAQGQRWPYPQAQDESPGAARVPASVPGLLARLAVAREPGEFSSVLQEILTISGVPEFGDRVSARRLLSEITWCIDPSRPDDCQLHADELSRIFQLVVIPDLDRPRVVKEIAEWAATAPPPVIRGLLASAQARGRADKSPFPQLISILEPMLARRWIEEHGLQADWRRSPVTGRWWARRPRSTAPLPACGTAGSATRPSGPGRG
jgi:hypothetical protein